MDTINLTNVYKKHKGLWVGLKDDQKTVVASGKTVKEVMQQAKKKGYPTPILFRVPTEITPFIGIF